MPATLLSLPSQDLLRNRLWYFPDTGLLHWRHGVGNRPVGSFAGCLNKSTNYWQITIDGQLYRSHRIIWKREFGWDPPNQIDHINGDRSDNRIENLRLATPTENSRNRNQKSRYLKGAQPSTNSATWQSFIKANGKNIFLGCYATEQAAHIAYCKAAERLHGEFANLGVES